MPQLRTPSDETAADTAAISVTIDAACRATGLGRSKLYQLIRDGELRIAKIGRRTIVPTDDLRALIDRHRVPGPPAPSPKRRKARVPQARKAA